MLSEDGLLASEGMLRLVWFVLTSMAAASLVALTVSSAVVCWWLVRSGRVARPFWLLFAASVSVAAILSVTLLRCPGTRRAPGSVVG